VLIHIRPLAFSKQATLGFYRVVARSNAAHEGRWDKSANDSLKVRGKTLGIIGYGNIGSQLSNLAEALGMRVIFYDHTDKLRHGNTEPVGSFQERTQVHRLQRQRFDHGRGQFSPGPAAVSAMGTRFIQVQCNVPGMLGRLNEVLARHAVNIAAQYYETDDDVGYVVLDADTSAADSPRVLADIRASEGTIRARLLT
jgi:hypothetical protein